MTSFPAPHCLQHLSSPQRQLMEHPIQPLFLTLLILSPAMSLFRELSKSPTPYSMPRCRDPAQHQNEGSHGRSVKQSPPLPTYLQPNRHESKKMIDKSILGIQSKAGICLTLFAWIWFSGHTRTDLFTTEQVLHIVIYFWSSKLAHRPNTLVVWRSKVGPSPSTLVRRVGNVYAHRYLNILKRKPFGQFR